MTELIGYVVAIFVGVVIGLAGGGGSILTVPIFVYLFAIEPVLATTYSLFVVGVTSLVGSVGYALRNQIDFRVTAAFSLPSFISVFVARRFLVPAMPDPLFQYGSLILLKQDAILYFFAFVMIMAASAMIRTQSGSANEINADHPSAHQGRPQYGILALDGFAVGLLTGTIGAGGGFLIVPMLVLLARLPIHRAVATSVLIIAVNSFMGFLGDVHHNDLNWPFILKFTAFSVSGIFGGMYGARLVSPIALKRGFGWFVMAVAWYMVVREILHPR